MRTSKIPHIESRVGKRGDSLAPDESGGVRRGKGKNAGGRTLRRSSMQRTEKNSYRGSLNHKKGGPS